jgi:hypothetical protein
MTRARGLLSSKYNYCLISLLSNLLDWHTINKKHFEHDRNSRKNKKRTYKKSINVCSFLESMKSVLSNSKSYAKFFFSKDDENDCELKFLTEFNWSTSCLVKVHMSPIQLTITKLFVLSSIGNNNDRTLTFLY